MKPKKTESEYSRDNFARTSQEVPFFPFRPVSMAHIEMDGIEQLQFDFVQQAGQPSRPMDSSSSEENKEETK